jgi:agmatine deiminase
LPWPEPRNDETGQRLPATYANFLVINGAVLVPTYHDPSDALALSAVGQAFPGRAIIGIDCRPLILQHGSLHCVTMQLPHGVLS